MDRQPRNKLQVLTLLGANTSEDLHLKSVEQSHFIRVLIACDGSRTLAAELLGVPRRTLQRKLAVVDPSRLVGLNLVDERSSRRRNGARRDHAARKRGPAPRIDGVRVLELRARKESWANIAQQLQCSRAGAVVAAKRAEGDGLKPKRKWVRINGADVIALRTKRRSWKQIAAQLGCSPAGARLAAERLQPDRGKSISVLARRVGCKPAEVRELLGRLPMDTSTGQRRRLVLDLRFSKKLTYEAIGGELGVTIERVRQIVRNGIEQLVEIQKGRGNISARLKKAIYYRVGTAEWKLEEIASKLDCYGLLRTKNMGIKSVRELHGHLRALNVTMGCGCPAVPCESARRGHLITPREPRLLESEAPEPTSA